MQSKHAPWEPHTNWGEIFFCILPYLNIRVIPRGFYLVFMNITNLSSSSASTMSNTKELFTKYSIIANINYLNLYYLKMELQVHIQEFSLYYMYIVCMHSIEQVDDHDYVYEPYHELNYKTGCTMLALCLMVSHAYYVQMYAGQA